ncbi:hypothetical protein ACFZCY_18755 [Streptomyces sp. NPDC007983]|uniref:hypothetical protein n=1 Tax=Streptomyces sp. NPDC007983 TaxID=3364800 RepID=UPI0036EE415D
MADGSGGSGREPFHPSGLDLSSSALRFLTARLREHRRVLGTRWRRLSTGWQALLTLAHLTFVLCLRILQSALVYVNPLMLQGILGEPEWPDLLTPADRRGLTVRFEPIAAA